MCFYVSGSVCIMSANICHQFNTKSWLHCWEAVKHYMNVPFIHLSKNSYCRFYIVGTLCQAHKLWTQKKWNVEQMINENSKQKKSMNYRMKLNCVCILHARFKPINLSQKLLELLKSRLYVSFRSYLIYWLTKNRKKSFRSSQHTRISYQFDDSKCVFFFDNFACKQKMSTNWFYYQQIVAVTSACEYAVQIHLFNFIMSCDSF